MTRPYKKKELPTKPHEKSKYEHGKAHSRIVTTEYDENWMTYPDEVEKDFNSTLSADSYLEHIKLSCEQFLSTRGLPTSANVYAKIKFPDKGKIISSDDQIKKEYANQVSRLYKTADWVSLNLFDDRKAGFGVSRKCLSDYMINIKHYHHDDLETLAAKMIEKVDFIKTKQLYVSAESARENRDAALIEVGELFALFKMYRKMFPRQKSKAKLPRANAISSLITELAIQKRSTDESARQLWDKFIHLIENSDVFNDIEQQRPNANQPKTWFFTYYLNKDNAKQKTFRFGTFSKNLSKAKKLLP